MHYAYLGVGLATIISMLVSAATAPIQRDEIEHKLKSISVKEWKQAAKTCADSLKANTITTQDSNGVIYCLSTSGKLLMTFDKPKKDQQ